MKKLQKMQINSERLMNNEELLRLRGGDDPPCGYPCTSDTQCYFPCQHCSDVPGNPDFKVCASPGGPD